MHPTGEELLRGVQGTLTTYVLPEVQSAYARSEMMIAQVLLGMVANEWDGAAQRLVDGNATLRALARRVGEALGNAGEELGGGATALATELRSLAAGVDASVRISELTDSRDALRAAIGRAGVLAQGSDTPAMRSLRREIIEHLRGDLESRSLSLLGPRADG